MMTVPRPGFGPLRRPNPQGEREKTPHPDWSALRPNLRIAEREKGRAVRVAVPFVIPASRRRRARSASECARPAPGCSGLLESSRGRWRSARGIRRAFPPYKGRFLKIGFSPGGRRAAYLLRYRNELTT